MIKFKGLCSIFENMIIARGLSILSIRLDRGKALTSAEDLNNYLQLKLARLPIEVFGLVLLDNRNHILAIDTLFEGTVDSTAVYPREVVRKVINENATSVIFYHNHPSGISEPSRADIFLTRMLKDALRTIDVTTVDHLIVSSQNVVSLAERGFLNHR